MNNTVVSRQSSRPKTGHGSSRIRFLEMNVYSTFFGFRSVLGVALTHQIRDSENKENVKTKKRKQRWENNRKRTATNKSKKGWKLVWPYQEIVRNVKVPACIACKIIETAYLDNVFIFVSFVIQCKMYVKIHLVFHRTWVFYFNARSPSL